MKAQLVKENISDILKPKSKEEIDLISKRLEQQTDEFMTKIFSDLHQDTNNPNIYRNSKGEWMFRLDLKFGYVWINYGKVWLFFENKLGVNDTNIFILIKNWFKDNTDWPAFKIGWDTI